MRAERCGIGNAATITVFAIAIAGCDLDNPGVPLPAATLNFPIALAVVDGAPETNDDDYLLVVSSNFDVRYASGSVQSWRLAELQTAIDDAVAGVDDLGVDCGEDGRPACEIQIEERPEVFLQDEVRIPSHADGIAVGPSEDRIYLPVRSGRGGLTWIDLADGLFGCGEGDACDDLHNTVAVAPVSRELSLPTDPVALAVVPRDLVGGGDADAIVIAHRNGSGSLLLDDLRGQPTLFDVIDGLPTDVVSAEMDPESGAVWLTSAPPSSRPTRDLVAVAPIVSDVDTRLAVVNRITLAGLDDGGTGSDTRDIAFDVGVDRAWVLARRPEAVITVDFRVPPVAPNLAPLGEIFAVASGPSRLERVVVPFDPDGDEGPIPARERTYLLASCYDANNVSVIDPELGLIATVAGLAGPFEMAYDATRELLFVINFRNNTIGVVDLSPLRTGASPRLIAYLGDPDAPSPFSG
ncbi:YncE family protein [Sandaracinus amylolyticus]|uniref:Lipoprotein n=1 Tax=Sandaracinus amylolyticus TaxID=927083 RepID=A0A0F6YIE6_9BACT|nr:hypothetical protein [Sandaracinus amylolyticus]AKF06601.1 hypothetical protein DB32_003750 [Sandaracinus amylolyticus]